MSSASRPLNPQQACRARWLAQNRCPNCGKPRAEGDTQTLLCAPCRARKNNRSNAYYAEQRAKNPPDFARAPDKPFRYGKTRLNNPRRITIELDEETYGLIHACRQYYCLSPAYEPYQVSAVIRRLLSLLPDIPGPIFASGFMPRRGANIGLLLCFMCDAENRARITAHQQATGGTFAQSVRACIQHAAQYAMTLPGEEAKRLLWPGYAELAPPAATG